MQILVKSFDTRITVKFNGKNIYYKLKNFLSLNLNFIHLDITVYIWYSFHISLSQVLSGIRKKEILSAFYGDITSHYHWAKNTTTHPPNKIHFENLGYFFSMCCSCLAKLFSLPDITWKVLHSFHAAGKFPSCEI